MTNMELVLWQKERKIVMTTVATLSHASYSVRVNYDLTVEEAVRDGEYDWRDPGVTSANFPSTRQGVADLKIILVQYGRVMKDEAILKDMYKQGLRGLLLPELLALGAKYPDLQRKLLIVARGSVWLVPMGGARSVRGVPCLFGFGGERRLCLHWLHYRWGSDCQFAAVRK